MICCVHAVGYTMNVVYFGWVDSAVELQDDLDIPQFTLLGTKQNDCSQNYTAGTTRIFPCRCDLYIQ